MMTIKEIQEKYADIKNQCKNTMLSDKYLEESSHFTRDDVGEAEEFSYGIMYIQDKIVFDLIDSCLEHINKLKEEYE